MRRIIIIALTTTLLVGCKIQIVVPAGVSVVSESGVINCLAGKTCTIEVVDIFFDEVIVAIPEQGYDFKQWKKQTKGLCGNSKEPCALSTALFVDNEGLLAILESDEVFYLEPVVQRLDGPIAEQDASVCFNPDLWEPGSRFEAEYQTNHGVRETHDQLIEDPTTFEGRNVRLARDTITTNDPGSKSEELRYFKISVSQKRYTTYGIVARDIMPASPTLRQVNDPGALTRFDLSPGETYSQTFDATVTFEGDIPPGSPGRSVSRTMRTTTYVGVETIDIPAGEYDACRFETKTTTSAAGITFGNNETTWIGVDSGVPLKNLSDETENAMVEGTLNGKKL